MDENKTPAQQAPDTAAPETTNIEQTTQPETAPAPEGTEPGFHHQRTERFQRNIVRRRTIQLLIAPFYHQ